jgi:hypothetical protein
MQFIFLGVLVVFKVIFVWLILVFSKITERFGVKKVIIVTTCIVMVLFGDTLIPAIFHVLHTLWEIVETVIEHFLENWFHLTPKQAEMATAWMGILTMVGVVLKLIYESYKYSVLLWSRLPKFLNDLNEEFKNNPLKIGWLLVLASFSIFGASFFIM